MKPKFFNTPADFRKWLEQNHDKASESLIEYSARGERLGLLKPQKSTKSNE